MFEKLAKIPPVSRVASSVALISALLLPARSATAADLHPSLKKDPTPTTWSPSQSKDWQRWLSYPKQIPPVAISNVPYHEVMRHYELGGAKEMRDEKIVFTGAEPYSAKVLTSQVNSTTSYGDHVFDASKFLWEYQRRLPDVGENLIESVGAQALKFRRFPILMSQIAKLSGTKSPIDCKESALMVAGCVMNQIMIHIRSGETANVAIVGGLYFGPNIATNGSGHCWTSVSWRGQQSIIDVQITTNIAEVVRPINSESHVGTARCSFVVTKEGTNPPTVASFQEALLTPPKR